MSDTAHTQTTARLAAAAVAGTTTALALVFSGAAGAAAAPEDEQGGMEPIADGAVHACIGWLLPATGTLVFSVMGSEAIHTPVPADELELDLQPTCGADRPVLMDVTYRNGIGTVPLWKMRATLQESWGAEAHGTNSVLRFRGERVGSSQVNLYGEASQPTYEHGCGTYPTAAGEVSPTVEVKTVQAGTTVPVPWKTAIDPRGGRDATVPVELISQSSTPTVSGESIAATEPGIYVVDQVFAGVDGSEYRKWTVVEALTAEDWAAYQTDPDEQSTVPIPEGAPVGPDPAHPGDPADPAPEDPAEPADPTVPEDPSEPVPGDDQHPVDPTPDGEAPADEEDHTVPEKVDTGEATGGFLLAGGMGLAGAAGLLLLRRRLIR